MNNKRARKIREEVYGKDYSPRHRKYKVGIAGNIIADEKRQAYQKAKKAYKEAK